MQATINTFSESDSAGTIEILNKKQRQKIFKIIKYLQTSRSEETSKQTNKKSAPRNTVIGIENAKCICPPLKSRIKRQTALRFVNFPGSLKNFFFI
jgi:hypothetical protein